MTDRYFPVDSSGHLISEGDTVAFNQSGAVVKGTVVVIFPRTDSIARNTKPFEWGKSLQWIVSIKDSSGHVSKVKNTDGILVI